MKNLQLTKEQIQKIAAAVVVGGLAVYSYVSYFWLPLSKKISENNAKIEAIDKDITNAKRQKEKFKDLEAELGSLRIEKEAAQKKLPAEKKFPDLLRTLTDLSKKYNISIQAINPAGSAQIEYFTKVSYSLSVRGTYHSLGRFVTAIGIQERILSIENITMSASPGQDGSTISANFTLVAYQYSG